MEILANVILVYWAVSSLFLFAVWDLLQESADSLLEKDPSIQAMQRRLGSNALFRLTFCFLISWIFIPYIFYEAGARLKAIYLLRFWHRYGAKLGLMSYKESVFKSLEVLKLEKDRLEDHSIETTYYRNISREYLWLKTKVEEILCTPQ